MTPRPASIRSSTRRRRAAAAIAVISLGLTAAACGGDDAEEGTDDSSGTSDGSAPAGTDPFGGVTSDPATTAGGPAPTGAGGEEGAGGSLTVLIGSSGDAETAAVQASAERFTAATGTAVEVVPAQDLNQQLTQGFAGGQPPDVFYLSPEQARQFQESLYPYGDEIDDVDDFYPNLIESYTIDDQLYCLPKDFSNLALLINTAAWETAGLTEADVPTTWDELTDVSTTLTTDTQTGLVFTGEADRVGVFMRQAGGWFLDDAQSEATAETPENEAAITYVQENLTNGNFQFSAQVEAGWGGEAFGTEKAAMTIEGPWIVGALAADYPDVEWMAAELPEGPAGPGTLTFTNCWGIAADGDTENAVALVQHLASAEEQQAFTTAFGVNPSRISLEEWNATEQPEQVAFNASIDYAQAPIGVPGFAAVKTDFNAQLEALAAGSTTPADLLERLQQTSEEVLADQ